MTKRLVAAVLCFILLVSLPVQVMAAGANDATPQTHPNTYKNTGNQRVDIIGVAKTQVGYLEGAGNNTKYGAALNINMLGWCGAFVSWCAIQAGVPNSVLYKTGVAAPASYGLSEKYYPAYVPQSGDLFFAMDNSHVGLVYYLEGEYFYSIEGNTYSQGPEGVYIRKHKLSSVKYASPNYQGGGSHSYASDSELAHPHKVFFHCSDCGDKYYNGATVTRDDCATCKQATCTHSYGKWSKTNDANHGRTCTKCAKTESANHSWDSGTVTQKANCKQDGIKTQTCTVCNGTRTVTIPKDSSHVYSSWTQQNDYSHTRTCTLCSAKESKAHTWDSGTVTVAATCMAPGVKTAKCTGCGATKESVVPISKTHNYSAWTSVDGTKHTHSCLICGIDEVFYHNFSSDYASNATEHWYECKDCKLQIKQDKHQFGAECDSPCKVCNYKSETGHHFSEEWSTDAQSHWYACQSCDIQGSAGYHQFDNACDPVCDTCGFQRQVQHTLTEEYETDGLHHWYTCTVCGIQEQYGSHESGEPAYEGAPTYCTVCQLVLTVEKDHEHVLSEAFGDEINHWGTCVCGEILETEPHVWSMKTGTCSACGATRPEAHSADDDVLPWLLGGVGLAGFVVLLLVVVIRISVKNKKRETELV